MFAEQFFAMIIVKDNVCWNISAVQLQCQIHQVALRRVCADCANTYLMNDTWLHLPHLLITHRQDCCCCQANLFLLAISSPFIFLSRLFSLLMFWVILLTPLYWGFYLYSHFVPSATHKSDLLTIRPSKFRTDALCEFVCSAVYVCWRCLSKCLSTATI